jgi:glycosyltransferase involved in cell wall biosynthesis
MRISIVTLSYNQRAFLREAIDSILQQDYPDVEYIVVDPGSTDGSRELLESYGDKITHLILEPDQGAADGLNKGFGRATGEVFGFLNADDFLLPGALRLVGEFFQSHPRCDMAFGDGYVVDAEGRKMRQVRARDFSVRRYLYGGTRWMQQSTFFRRKAFLLSPGFNIENRTSWDGELFVSMTQMGATAGYINADLAAFRIHGASISGTGRLEDTYREDCRRIFRQIRGREWRVTDELLCLLYKAEGLLLRTGWWLKTLARKRDAA